MDGWVRQCMHLNSPAASRDDAQAAARLHFSDMPLRTSFTCRAPTADGPAGGDLLHIHCTISTPESCWPLLSPPRATCQTVTEFQKRH